jgi:quercetin dioxygenase-like cupin family protein
MDEHHIPAQLSKYGLPFAPIQGNFENSPIYYYLQQKFRVLISPDKVGGSFGLLHMEEKRGMEPPPHVHTREDEIYLVQSGSIAYTVSGERFECVAGDVMFLPRNCVHSFEVLTPASNVLNFIMPGNFINYFLEMSLLQENRETSLSESVLKNLIATAMKYGISFPHLERP